MCSSYGFGVAELLASESRGAAAPVSARWGQRRRSCAWRCVLRVILPGGLASTRRALESPDP